MVEIEKSDYDAVNDFCKMIGDVQGMLLRVIREKEALERENKELNERIKDLTDKLRAAKKREEAAARIRNLRSAWQNCRSRACQHRAKRNSSVKILAASRLL